MAASEEDGAERTDRGSDGGPPHRAQTSELLDSALEDAIENAISLMFGDLEGDGKGEQLEREIDGAVGDAVSESEIVPAPAQAVSEEEIEEELAEGDLEILGEESDLEGLDALFDDGELGDDGELTEDHAEELNDAFASAALEAAEEGRPRRPSRPPMPVRARSSGLPRARPVIEPVREESGAAASAESPGDDSFGEEVLDAEDASRILEAEEAGVEALDAEDEAEVRESPPRPRADSGLTDIRSLAASYRLAEEVSGASVADPEPELPPAPTAGPVVSPPPREPMSRGAFHVLFGAFLLLLVVATAIATVIVLDPASRSGAAAEPAAPPAGSAAGSDERTAEPISAGGGVVSAPEAGEEQPSPAGAEPARALGEEPAGGEQEKARGRGEERRDSDRKRRREERAAAGEDAPEERAARDQEPAGSKDEDTALEPYGKQDPEEVACDEAACLIDEDLPCCKKFAGSEGGEDKEEPAGEDEGESEDPGEAEDPGDGETE